MLSKNELSKVSAAIKKHKARRVALQIPEGLKMQVQEIAKQIEPFAEVVILADPCFGACDIPFEKAKALGCQLIVHMGHADFGLKGSVPVVYIEKFSDINLEALGKQSKKLKYKKIGLVSTVQHVHVLNKIKKILQKEGKTILIAKPTKRIKYAGQILGCDLSSVKSVEKKVDCFLFVGSGRFHSLGILAATDKPVFQYDTEFDALISMDSQREQIERRKIVRKMKLADSKRVGILVSTKPGQINKDVFSLKNKLEKEGKKVWILAMDFISPEKLLGMSFDALINTACPRIEEDLTFSVPIINIADVYG